MVKYRDKYTEMHSQQNIKTWDITSNADILFVVIFHRTLIQYNRREQHMAGGPHRPTWVRGAALATCTNTDYFKNTAVSKFKLKWCRRQCILIVLRWRVCKRDSVTHGVWKRGDIVPFNSPGLSPVWKYHLHISPLNKTVLISKRDAISLFQFARWLRKTQMFPFNANIFFPFSIIHNHK